MKEYSVGPVEHDSWGFDDLPCNIAWIVYCYETAPYEGEGTAFIKYEDGTYDWHDMSHCSCYGGWCQYQEAHMTFEDAMRDLFGRYGDEKILAKVNEIEGTSYAFPAIPEGGGQ